MQTTLIKGFCTTKMSTITMMSCLIIHFALYGALFKQMVKGMVKKKKEFSTIVSMET